MAEVPDVLWISTIIGDICCEGLAHAAELSGRSRTLSFRSAAKGVRTKDQEALLHGYHHLSCGMFACAKQVCTAAAMHWNRTDNPRSATALESRQVALNGLIEIASSAAGLTFPSLPQHF